MEVNKRHTCTRTCKPTCICRSRLSLSKPMANIKYNIRMSEDICTE